MPVRHRRERTKGWTKPPGAVYVGRTRYGGYFANAWTIGSTGPIVLPGGWIDYRPHPPLSARRAVDSFTNSYSCDLDLLHLIRDELAGKDLMCWCRIGAPCHADWLMTVANSPQPISYFLDRTPRPTHWLTHRIETT